MTCTTTNCFQHGFASMGMWTSQHPLASSDGCITWRCRACAFASVRGELYLSFAALQFRHSFESWSAESGVDPSRASVHTSSGAIHHPSGNPTLVPSLGCAVSSVPRAGCHVYLGFADPPFGHGASCYPSGTPRVVSNPHPRLRNV